MITLKQISFKEAMKMVEEKKMGDLYILDSGNFFPAEFIEVSLSSLPERIFLKKGKE